jgi:1,2-dihydroxy-3-keto-5-methylthiopentene dioxygenase
VNKNHFGSTKQIECVKELSRNHFTKKSVNMTIEAWYMDSEEKDQRLEHKTDPLESVSREELKKIGVLSWEGINVDDLENDSVFIRIKEERGYDYQDVVNIDPESLKGYDELLKKFFTEHIHEDEEVRMLLDGSGYFDVRDANDKWIRIKLEKGDMIVLPEGIYHRFTPDTKNFGKAMRLFKGIPVWVPYNRPQEDHPSRGKYVSEFLN